MITLILTFAGGYGAVKGAASAARTTATVARMAWVGRGAELGGELVTAGGRVLGGAGAALAGLRGLSGAQVMAALGRARAAVPQILAAAQSYEVWAALRQGIATERAFWEAQRAFWAERAWLVDREHNALVARVQAFAAGSESSTALEEAAEQVLPEAQALDVTAGGLLREVTAQGWTRISRWDADAPRAVPFHQLSAEQLPHLEVGYGWFRDGERWVVYRSPDVPDVPLQLFYWPPDPEGLYSVAVVRQSDGARISSLAQFGDTPYTQANFPEARRAHNLDLRDPTGVTWDEGHMTEQGITTRSVESREQPSGDRLQDRRRYTSEHEANFTPEPSWWNQDARNQLVQLVVRARMGRSSRSALQPQRGSWADAAQYRMVQQFGPNSIRMIDSPRRGPMIAAEAEWFIIQDSTGGVLDAFRIPFDRGPVDARARDLGLGWEALLTELRIPLGEVPPIVLLVEAEPVEVVDGSRWILLAAGSLGAHQLTETEERDAKPR